MVRGLLTYDFTMFSTRLMSDSTVRPDDFVSRSFSQ